MLKPKSLSVVIVNYKTPMLCLGCLESLYEGDDEATAEILVVDNASGDGSVEMFNRSSTDNNRSKTSVISSEVNGGFSAGNNIGIKQSTSDFYSTTQQRHHRAPPRY